MSDERLWSSLERILDPSGAAVILDVGANRGDTTRFFLDLVPAATIFSFEPDPGAFTELARRYAAEPRVRPVNIACADRDGVASLHRGTDSTISSLYPRNTQGRRYYRRDLVMRDAMEVPCTTIDRFAEAHSLSAIRLLKLDVQGGEHAILRGSQKLLAAHAIDVVLTEFFVIPHYEGAPLLDGIWSLLRSHGYEMYDVFVGRRGRDGQARWGDAIFLSPPHRVRALDSQPEED